MRIHGKQMAIVACFLVPIGACGTTKPVRYYTLSTTTAPPALRQAPVGDKLIGVTRFTVPAYLDRPQIVTRGEGNRLILADFDRWAEPLTEGCARILAEELSALLPTYQVRHRGWLDQSLLDISIAVEVLRFERIAGGGLTLSAQWSVQRKGEQNGRANRGDYAIPTSDTSYDAVAQAMSQVLGQMAKDMASAVGADHRKP